MYIDDNGINLIKKFEGFRSKPYLCPAGVPTIGYGSTRYADGRKVTLQDTPISEEVATQLLLDTLASYEKCVNEKVKVRLSHNEFDALVSFTYNVGVGNFSSSTLLKKLNAGDRQGAADQLLRWNKAGGKVLAGLTKRRKAERDLFFEVLIGG